MPRPDIDGRILYRHAGTPKPSSPLTRVTWSTGACQIWRLPYKIFPEPWSPSHSAAYTDESRPPQHPKEDMRQVPTLQWRRGGPLRFSGRPKRFRCRLTRGRQLRRGRRSRRRCSRCHPNGPTTVQWPGRPRSETRLVRPTLVRSQGSARVSPCIPPRQRAIRTHTSAPAYIAIAYTTGRCRIIGPW